MDRRDETDGRQDVAGLQHDSVQSSTGVGT